MRTACLALSAALVCAAPAAAQTQPYLAEVTAESVPVRCGPSEQMPDTGTLFRGAKVVVDHEENDQWLAVEPPRGQVSWINHKFVAPVGGQSQDAIPRNALVQSEGEVEIAYGKPGVGQPLDVRRTKVPDSTVVLVVGQKVKHGDSFWYPIEPPAGDFRYVPKSAVRLVRGQPAQTYVVRSPSPSSVPPPAAGDAKPGFEPVAASVPGRAKPADWPNHPLWQQAEQAERAGDYPRAESLYLKLAAEMNQPNGDPDLANLCYARVHAVREKQRAAPRGGTSTDPGRRGDLPPSPAGQWVGPGSLRLAGFKLDGRQTFALVGPRGEVKCYAVAGPGVDLDRFRGYDVELFGTTTHPGDTRGVGVMTATRVQLSRDR